MTRKRRFTLDDLPNGGRRRRLRARGKRHGRRNAAAIVLVLLCGIPVVLVLSGMGAFAAFKNSCNLSSLQPVRIGENSFVYAADGSFLGSIPAEHNRQPVSLKQISPWMSRAVIAVEDKRFYQHGGVDYWGIVRAAYRDATKGKVVEGGSTITQQLVRNLYPVSRDRTVERKIKEACLAIKLSRHWSKDRILAAWMNQVYFGNHAYGVEAAAQTYFSKHARGLTMIEAALLAGLPQAPSLYDPILHPDLARDRRAVVLNRMYENHDITFAELQAGLADRSLHLRPGRLYTTIREPYFFSYVRDQLIAKYGAQTVQSGGLRVYTTIDPAFQRAARDAITQTLNEKDDPAAAVVSINPTNGAIRAMTASYPGRRKNQFNLVAQARRQAGSTFKTFVLTAAVNQGINPATATYVSAPFHYQPDPAIAAWDVSTYSHTYSGTISVQQATLQSDNTVYAQLTLDVGPENVAAMAHRLGVRSPLQAVPSIGLGANAVSPLDMASAYATLAAGGIYSEPMAIRRVILANGKEDGKAGWGSPRRHRVIPDGVAYTVTRILEQNVLYGTGTRANFGRPAAGKTGTTDDHADAWFCGYLPNLEATVWVGYPQAEIPMDNVHGIAVAGGSFPAEIWRLFMERAVRYSPPQDFALPRTYPVWKPFERGDYAIQYAPETTTSTTTTKQSTTKAVTTAPEPTTVQQETVPFEPTTTVAPSTTAPPPPPATTAPPPPPVTTAPPPPPVTTTPPPTTAVAPPPQ
ncbi:MAG TPA: PBP1A family penicillin-binding protein [Gaiellaceae bacterium]|nr:PBP1A family penicillin-binding protein [Gaiellaceae bacterium]